MKRVLEFLKEHKYLMVLLVVVSFSVTLGLTYSNFIVTSNNHKAAEMYIGALKYSIEIDGSSTNTLSVPTGETIIDVKVNNLNPVDTYYKLLYLKNSNLIVEYFSSAYDLDNSNNTTKSYDIPNDSVTSSNSKTIKLQITNNSTSSQTLGLSVKGGYITNTLSDIAIPSNYSEIASINTKASTYFCKTNDTLTQGLQYVNGQYTYYYNQEQYVDLDEGGIKWRKLDNDGWNVQLTNKESTESVTSKVCTYINDKPISSMSYMFNSSQAESIDLSNFNTTNVTNMYSMFSSSQATSLDLSSFDTSKVTDMVGMFSDSQATILDLSSFDTSKVTTMASMFYNSQATTINLSSFDTSKVTTMASMFYNSQATILDLSNFDTSKVYDMIWMFSGSKATTLDLSSFDTSSVKSMQSMFRDSKATSIDLSSFDTSSVTNMGEMFYNSQATILDVSKFDTSNVTNMIYMFANSQAITLDVSNFDTSNVHSMRYMFMNSQATALDVSNFDTSKVTTMASMFSGSKAATLNVSNFDTSNVWTMEHMFSGSQATTLDLSNFNTSKVENMWGMFQGSQATTLDVSNFDTSKVTNMHSMFWGIQATDLDLSNFDTSKVTSMAYMFYNSYNLKTIYVSDKFNTDNVTSSSNMFTYTSKLVGGAGTKYNSSYVDKTYARIDGGTSYPGYFTDVKDKPSTFGTDDWATVVSSVKAGNSRGYKVGDTKEIDLGTTYGTHTIRIANTSTPSECSTTGFSQTACGFVLEFVDTITENRMNNNGGPKGTNVKGWPATTMRTFINNDIYNSLPEDLKSGIINTTVVSGHGSEDTANFTSIDKLYLLSTAEIWAQGTSNKITSDSARNMTRQLDYYKAQGTSTDNYSAAIKKSDTIKNYWGLRSSCSDSNFAFHYVTSSGNHNGDNGLAGSIGVSPAFRIG